MYCMYVQAHTHAHAHTSQNTNILWSNIFWHWKLVKEMWRKMKHIEVLSMPFPNHTPPQHRPKP